MLIYQIVTINGKIIEFEAESYEEEGNYVSFMIEGEKIAEINKQNIAGYYQAGEDDE